MKNGTLMLDGSRMDYIQVGHGPEHMVIIPGLGDGLVTVKGKALLGQFMFRQFAARYTVTMLSREQPLEEDATTQTMARDLARALELLHIPGAHVVGISQGGMIAQHLAADRPDLVDRLVLVVTTPKATPILTANCEAWRALAQKGDYPGILIGFNEQAHPEPYLSKSRRMYPFMRMAGRLKDPRRFLIQAKACMTHDASAKLGRIAAPTLIIGGEQDRTLGPEGSRLLVQAIPGSTLYLYPDHGHALYEDAPDFNRRVLAFLQGEN